ncbi:hypothetical protein VTI28DRAFT_1964 [Corynascus sepedonium]
MFEKCFFFPVVTCERNEESDRVPPLEAEENQNSSTSRLPSLALGQKQPGRPAQSGKVCSWLKAGCCDWPDLGIVWAARGGLASLSLPPAAAGDVTARYGSRAFSLPTVPDPGQTSNTKQSVVFASLQVGCYTNQAVATSGRSHKVGHNPYCPTMKKTSGLNRKRRSYLV